MGSGKILWVDDEIEHLKPFIYLLEKRGYEVTGVPNGDDALSILKEISFDLVLLDQMMPGRDGLSTLTSIKGIDPYIPVVMVTKSEEERVMDEAYAKRIDDFLVKPLDSKQLISLLKRTLEKEDLVRLRIGEEYASQMNELRELLSEGPDWSEWVEVHRKLALWDLLLSRYRDTGLKSSHKDQKKSCNREFAKFVEGSYLSWIEEEDGPLLSPHLLKEHVFPLIREGRRVLFLLLDCMRLDQWLSIRPLLGDYYHFQEDYYFSILPTATPYSRNAIFSGLFPSEILSLYPQYWETDEELSQNRHERELLDAHLDRVNLKLRAKPDYVKVLTLEGAQEVESRVTSFIKSPFVALVVNFVDLLTHQRSESRVLKELTPDEESFRSLTSSWFSHSPIYELLKAVSKADVAVVITTDHGSICGERATPIYGGKEISQNLRYKYGPSIRCQERDAFLIRDPKRYKLPADVANKRYAICKEDYYFCYPTHFQKYEKTYRGTFQHGGISLEEMVLPVVTLKQK